jgi:hypothetical protein
MEFPFPGRMLIESAEQGEVQNIKAIIKRYEKTKEDSILTSVEEAFLEASKNGHFYILVLLAHKFEISEKFLCTSLRCAKLKKHERCIEFIEDLSRCYDDSDNYDSDCGECGRCIHCGGQCK